MRLYLLIFHGSYRGDDDHLEHLHKPSWGMKSALIILGALSLCGGLMGIPYGDLNVFAAWLAPMFSDTASLFKTTQEHSLEYVLMAVSPGIALIGVGIAWISEMYMHIQCCRQNHSIYYSILVTFENFLDRFYFTFGDTYACIYQTPSRNPCPQESSVEH